MAVGTSSDRGTCFICEKEKVVYPCGGCSQRFCFNHLGEHLQQLSKQFEGIENERDEFYQMFIKQKENRKTHPLIQLVNKWKEESINKIKQTAEECRQLLTQHINKHILDTENKLRKLTQQLKQIRKDNEFNEIDMNQLKKELKRIREELDQPQNISIQKDPASFISKILVIISSGK